MPLSELQTCREPREWPAAPVELSVSSLHEIEECPRRWSLRHARYEEIWTRQGYPVAPTPATLAGSAVHLALQRIVGELIRAGSVSAQGSGVVEVMRRLGGYTAVVEQAALKLLSDLRENPRSAARAGPMRRALLRQVPQLRERVQRLLSRLRLGARATASPGHAGPAVRRPLGPGSHAEVRLRAPHIGWRGTADLVTVDEVGCEISDFKTGDRSDSHGFQLQVYALLWRVDSELNPEATRAHRLVIAYASADVDVPPPTDAQLEELECALVGRSQAARAQLDARPPPAMPHPEACAWCPVRHLCAEYWKSDVVRRVHPLPSKFAQSEGYEDVELELLEPHGPGMWSAVVLVSSSLERDRLAKLQLAAEHVAVARRGRRLRLLGVRVIDVKETDGEEPEALIAPSAWSELFVCEARSAMNPQV